MAEPTYVCGGCGAHLDGIGVAHSCAAEIVRLRAERDRYHQAPKRRSIAFRASDALNFADEILAYCREAGLTRDEGERFMEEIAGAFDQQVHELGEADRA